MRIPFWISSVCSPRLPLILGFLSTFNLLTILCKYSSPCGLVPVRAFPPLWTFFLVVSPRTFTGASAFWLSSLRSIPSPVVVRFRALIKVHLQCLLHLYLSFLALAFLGCPLSLPRELVFHGSELSEWQLSMGIRSQGLSQKTMAPPLRMCSLCCLR